MDHEAARDPPLSRPWSPVGATRPLRPLVLLLGVLLVVCVSATASEYSATNIGYYGRHSARPQVVQSPYTYESRRFHIPASSGGAYISATVNARGYATSQQGGSTGVYAPALVTWRDCVSACVDPCVAADFDAITGACWHHHYPEGGEGGVSCALPTPHQRLGVVQYRVRACVGLHGLSEVLDEGSQSAFYNPHPSLHLPPPPIPRPLSPPHSHSLPRYASAVDYPAAPPQPPPAPATGCGRPSSPPLEGRIVGGAEARPRSWPWQIALRNKHARSSRCAGSLIAPQWVLTTAHCVDQDTVPGNWLVLSGAHDLLAVESSRVAHSVDEIVLHSQFNLDTFDNDVALVRLATPVEWGANASPVCLPGPDQELKAGAQCVITGWGVATNGRRPLKQAAVPLVPMETCRRRDWLGLEFTLSDRMMCAGFEHGGTDTCQGDSGGPLVCFVNDRWVQAGVTSFGRGCGLPQKPGVYAKVSKFIAWINAVTSQYQ